MAKFVHISSGIDTRVFCNILSKSWDVSAVKKCKNVQFQLISPVLESPQYNASRTCFWFKVTERNIRKHEVNFLLKNSEKLILLIISHSEIYES